MHAWDLCKLSCNCHSQQGGFEDDHLDLDRADDQAHAMRAGSRDLMHGINECLEPLWQA